MSLFFMGNMKIKIGPKSQIYFTHLAQIILDLNICADSKAVNNYIMYNAGPIFLLLKISICKEN